MSNKLTLSFGGLATILAGFVLTSTGLLLAFNTWNTTAGDVDPWFFGPIGVVVAVFGLVMMLSREDT